MQYRDDMERRAAWRWVQDAAAAAVVGTMGLLEIWVPFESVQGNAVPVRASIVVVCCAVFLAFRRARPIVLIGVPLVWFALGVWLGGDIPILFFGQLVPFVFALYSAARHAPPRVALIVCGTILAAVVATDLTVVELQGPEELIFHWTVFLLAIGIGWGLRSSERRAVDAAVRASTAEADAREQALRAVAEERARIARELHDILGHSVSVMVVQAGAAQAASDDAAFVSRALEAIRTTGAQALDDVRRVVELLRTDEESLLAPQPGLGELPLLLEQARADGLRVEFEQAGAPPPLSPGQGLALYRVVQEALTNVRKHADATCVRVRIDADPERVVLTVADDGSARSDRTGGGHGLVGMRERVSAYRGELAAGPDPSGGGWRVQATIPLREAGETAVVAGDAAAGGRSW